MSARAQLSPVVPRSNGKFRRSARVAVLKPELNQLCIEGAEPIGVSAVLQPVIGWLLAEPHAVSLSDIVDTWLRLCATRSPLPPSQRPDWARIAEVLVAAGALQIEVERDLIDVEPRYVESREMQGWEREVRAFFESKVLPLPLPARLVRNRPAAPAQRLRPTGQFRNCAGTTLATVVSVVRSLGIAF